MFFFNFSVSFVAFVLVVVVGQQQHDPNYCYVTDPIRPQLSRFSSRTAYETIRGRTINPGVSTCTPAKFWFYSRHAARLPGVNDIGRMSTIHTQVNNIIAARAAGRGQAVCQQDFNLMNGWRFDPNITVEVEQFLTVAGWNEMVGIAQRYRNAFPTLLTPYNRNWYTFRHTDRQRTQASVRAFADGLFGHNGYQQVVVEPVLNPDRLLRPHDGCHLYDAASDNTVERGLWQNGPEFQTMMNQVNDKLGLQGNQRLTARQTRTLWEICNFEQLWYSNYPAPFCGAFSPFNNLMLEYFEDLDYYYNAGFGGPRRLFENLNCPLIQDLLGFLDTSDTTENVRIYSTHSTAFQLFLVTLGVFGNDVPLTASNFAQQANRQWRSSLHTPMAVNIAAIRYNCLNGDNDVLFLMNEQPLLIPGCQANGLCKVNYIRQRYSRFIGVNCGTLSCSNN
ncbi:Multiple inositol polyphosphate phosphatase 1 [Pseudolycoriella hygida]|uniref:Multiple inositol polyphosphate phosphatase 1 n=1 Tax=Pseudolycoriella hygida TaxID=35572 RepID=A0A9Q0S7L6_9DIPT|nr:Multiple inositol polyphosphate phosphatase 1 [Pseudolycoriella hygida]